MKCKYKLVYLDYSDWSDYVKINRNVEKENKLFYDQFGVETKCIINYTK